MRIVATKHFLERLGERQFDLSIIAKLHMEFLQNPLNSDMVRVTSDNATVVAKREGSVIKLITGWMGKDE